MSREVKIISIGDIQAETVGSHGRTQPVRAKGFNLDTAVPGVMMEFEWVFVPEGYATPRHRHCFDQVRYVLDGTFGVGRSFEIDAGQVGYFPEGVDYGPQLQTADATVLILQFQGPSGVAYLTHAELHKAQKRLEAKGATFEGGVYRYTRSDGKTIHMDSHKAIWEEATARTLNFPKGRFRHPVVMLPETERWLPDRKRTGIEHKHLGTFSETRTGIGLSRLAAGAELPKEHLEDAEIRYLLEGTIKYGGKTWQGGRGEDVGTCLYVPFDTDVDAIHSSTGATFFTITLPVIAEAEAERRRSERGEAVAV